MNIRRHLNAFALVHGLVFVLLFAGVAPVAAQQQVGIKVHQKAANQLSAGARYSVARSPLVNPATTEVKTAFRPQNNGLGFVNDFVNDFIPQLDYRTNGLCGGMSYATLDYYFTGTPRPGQAFQPANKTTLYNYLYGRQVTSITSNLDKWGEVGFNPAGARNSDFFNWGVSTKQGDRIDELKSFIDRGVPVALGMQGDGSTGNHQVIAYGYDFGPGKGGIGTSLEGFKIFICDPNDPGETRTLVPDFGRHLFYYLEQPSKTWRTYFVDKNYHTQQPPKIPNGSYPHDGRIYELVLDFGTGGDDLRGGNDNVNVQVNLADGSQQTYNNVNLGGRWVVNYHQDAEIALQRPLRPDEIKSLVVTTTFTGGIAGDNWDMSSLHVHTWGGGFYDDVKQVGFKRFTGDDHYLSIPLMLKNPPPGDLESESNRPPRLADAVVVVTATINGIADTAPIDPQYRELVTDYAKVRINGNYVVDPVGQPQRFVQSVSLIDNPVPIQIEIWREIKWKTIRIGPDANGKVFNKRVPDGIKAGLLRTLDLSYDVKTHQFTGSEAGRSAALFGAISGPANRVVVAGGHGPDSPGLTFTITDDGAKPSRPIDRPLPREERPRPLNH